MMHTPSSSGREKGPNEKSSAKKGLARATLADLAPFGGRDKEMREIAFHLGEAEPGAAHNLLITGSVGVGKTLLLTKLSTESKLARKWAWLRLRTTRAAAESPALLFARMVGSLRVAAAGLHPSKKQSKQKKAAKDDADIGAPEFASSFANTPALAKWIRNLMNVRFLPAGKKGLIFAIDDAHLLSPPNSGETNHLQEILMLAQMLQGSEPYPVSLVLCGLPKLTRSLPRCRGYRQEFFKHVKLGEIARRDFQRMVRNWAAAAGLKAEMKPYIRDVYKAAGGNPRIFTMWCEQILAALRTGPERAPAALIAAVGDWVRTDFFEQHWQITTKRERELLRLIAKSRDEKGNFTLQDLTTEAKRQGVELTRSNAHQILARLEQKELLCAVSHGNYRLTMLLFDDFISRCGGATPS